MASALLTLHAACLRWPHHAYDCHGLCMQTICCGLVMQDIITESFFQLHNSVERLYPLALACLYCSDWSDHTYLPVNNCTAHKSAGLHDFP